MIGLTRNLSEIVAGSSTLIIIIILTIGGNCMVIASIFTYRPLKKAQNFFLVSLAVSDLSVAITVMPFHVVKFITGTWPFGHVLCKMWITLDIWLCTASILNLCMIALDRYWAIRDPVKYANQRTPMLVLILTTAAWILALLISVPPLLGWNDWASNGTAITLCEYTNKQGYVIYSALGSFYLPLLLMTTVYIRIYIAAKKRLRERKRESSVGSKAESMLLNRQNKYGSRTESRLVVGFEQDGASSRSHGAHSAIDFKIEHSEDHTHDHDHSDSHDVSTQSTPRARRATFRHRLHSARRAISTNWQARRPKKSEPQSGLMMNTIPHLLHRATLLTMREKDTPQEVSNNLTLRSFFQQREKISVAKEKKAAKTLAIIMGVFVLCWLPFFLMYIINPFCDHCIHPKVFEASNWLGYINSSLNPVIYTIFNLDFRKAFNRILLRFFQRRQSQTQ